MSTTTPSIITIFTIILSLLLSSSLSQTLSSSSSSSSYNDEEPKSYIVHVSKLDKPSIFSSHLDWYTSALQSLPAHLSLLSHPREVIIYTYNHVIHGFAARLTHSQASYLRSFPGILSILPQRIHQIQTTQTPSFLGLTENSGLWPDSKYGSDIIIGVLDTGIWPESQSFNDSGLTNPVPKKWKGVCDTAPDFPNTSCNKKIIGARSYYKGIEAQIGQKLNETRDPKSPRDTLGHGTHTASTAAGSVVKNAGFYEYGVGDAKGIATKARIAIYKVCWSYGCNGVDVIAGMDQAVADGVDVVSMSLGPNGLAVSYDEDSFAIAAFGAVEKGVLVSASAMNSGPGPSTAVNIAPWFLTVGASTIDREFPCIVSLGDGRNFSGVSLYSGKSLEKTDLVFAGDIGNQFCVAGELNSTQAKGKIVLCSPGDIVSQGNAVKIAGGVGLIGGIPIEHGDGLTAGSPMIPGATVNFNNGLSIYGYIKSQKKPVASIVFRGTVTGSSLSAPKVASFSSRGPNHITPEILKPDIIAPGVNILAAWTGAAGPSKFEFDERRVKFNIISGTSMACPHVSGIAAMLRKAHPKWTPAAIKSALMTTTYNSDKAGKQITDLATRNISNPFQHGAGHVDPNNALNPGLVYDIQPSDYEAFLCSIGYNPRQISLFVKDRKVDCGLNKLAAGPGDLNYPSFSVVFKSSSGSVIKYKRVVTNVGRLPVATYRVKVNSPPSVKISVSPRILVFALRNQKLSYEVTFTSLRKNDSNTAKMEFGAIEWISVVHGTVRSPITVVWPAPSAIPSTTNLISSF
ncbi:subtilisin-like protease SBT1.4 [Papaver somniferum]|uniref:subtilisin-like protease SBT1.4 n=1 Tax=Papaver somniferum TaxID=3469 RepID=UPI000E6FEA16|nr:subtilisin-like protease SBT1.4 [Papaver somniferum]